MPPFDIGYGAARTGIFGGAFFMLGLLHHSHGRCFETAHPAMLAKECSTEWVVALERGASLVVKPRLT